MKTTLKISCVLLFAFASITKAQHGESEKYSSNNTKAIKAYKTGLEYYNARKNEKALEELQTAIKKDSNFIEPYIIMANIYAELREYEQAIAAYAKTFQINPEFFPNNYFYAGTMEAGVANYDIAAKHLQKFLSYDNRNPEFKKLAQQVINNCTFARQAIEHPKPFKPLNMGENINSPADEYFPSITADGQTLLITRDIKDTRALEGHQEDFYISKKIDNKWTAAQSVPGVNTPGNEGAPSISADGRIVFFAACQEIDASYGEKRTGYGSCDIFYALKNGDRWTKTGNIGQPINSRNWETQPSFSSDGKTLYFIRGTVTREGIKDQDIYSSQLTDKGTWGVPMRLSDKINTSGTEESVFIHPDNQTLYFASDGHIGMGGLDIFMSKRQANGEWGEAVNLGYPINTNTDENSLLVAPDGDIAYFASNRAGGYGGLDLYQFELYKEAKPEKITYVKGKVFDSVTKKLLNAKFELIDLETSKTVIESESDAGSGAFLVCLPVNKNYALNVSKNGYLFYSENFSLKNLADASQPFLMDIPLQAIDTGMTVELKNIFFETNKFNLKEESQAELQKLITFLNYNKTLRIEISGHTDDVGDKKLNQQLSQNRAKAVYDFLITHAIPAERLTYKGYGDSLPKLSNSIAENRAKNRRTEFKVIAK